MPNKAVLIYVFSVTEIVTCSHFNWIHNCNTLLYSSELYYFVLFTFTFSHLADAFIQSDLQMRTLEAIKPTKEQQRASAMTSLG